jgi:diguanylate cyclase
VSPLLLVLLWVLPSVLVGLVIGYYMAYTAAAARDQEVAHKEREATLSALLKVLENTEKLSSDVDTRNEELAKVGQKVEDLDVTGEFADVQHEVLEQIAKVIHMNKQLESDLSCARYQLEEQAQELDHARKEARTDALSGTFNRKAFDETLEYLLSKMRRDNDSFSLVLCDIDRFKWVNDTHGHAAGDKVVSVVGETLKDSVRGDDYVARYGGDEFAILLRHATGEQCALVAQRICERIARMNFDAGTTGERCAVTLSMGLATAQQGESSQSLLERADRALYESKHQGRNQLHAWKAEGELVKVG